MSEETGQERDAKQSLAADMVLAVFPYLSALPPSVMASVMESWRVSLQKYRVMFTEQADAR